jgi:glucokinase
MDEERVGSEQQLVGAIDIGGTKIALGLVGHDGCVITRRSLSTRDLANGTIGVEAIARGLTECIQEVGNAPDGIGIGCTGPVDLISGEIGKVGNLPGWQGCRIVEEIRTRVGIRTVMENDADAAALAEARWGSGRGVERFLYITLSTGIGAGFLLGSDVYRGAGGSHPEMGHHAIDPNGPPCYCGARGCWESLASGNALRDWFLENDREKRFSVDTLSARAIFELYTAGDRVAEEAVDRLSYYVGIGIANLTTILVPDVIAIGGGLTRGSALFLDRAVRIFRERCGEVPAERTVVRTAVLEENLDLAGAAAVWLQSLKRGDAIEVSR